MRLPLADDAHISVSPEAYDPTKNAPMGFATIHAAQRWRERFDPSLNSDDEASQALMEAFSQSVFIFSEIDREGKPSNYYLYRTASGRGLLFVQDPKSLKIVTTYEVSYGLGSKVDQVAFDLLYEEYQACRERHDRIRGGIQTRIAVLESEERMVTAEIEAFQMKLKRIQNEKEATSSQLKEAESELRLCASRITRSIDYNLEQMQAKAARSRVG